MKKTKKIVALALATTMVMAPTAVFAADTASTTSPVSDSAVGTGTNEGTVDKELFSVILPSQADNQHTFDFILDPEGLIAEAAKNSGSKADYTGKVFESGKNLFFATPKTKTAGGSYDYASTSDKLKVINVGTTKVDVTLTATAKNVTGGAVFTDDAVATGAATSIYMALNADGVTTPSAINAETLDASLSATVDAVADDCYLVKAKSDNSGYELVQKSGFDKDTDGKKLEFWLTGHCNSDAKWTGDETADVEVVWKLSKASGTPTVTASTTELTWADRTQPFTFTVDSSVSFVDVGVAYNGSIYTYTGVFNGDTTLAAAGFVNVNGNTITLNPSFSQYIPSGDTFYLCAGAGDAGKGIVIK